MSSLPWQSLAFPTNDQTNTEYYMLCTSNGGTSTGVCPTGVSFNTFNYTVKIDSTIPSNSEFSVQVIAHSKILNPWVSVSKSFKFQVSGSVGSCSSTIMQSTLIQDISVDGSNGPTT